MEGCAAPRRRDSEEGGGTWISPEFISAYERLHGLGYAHCVEVWNGERLVGGLYGVSIGSFFAGESMFSAETDASKVAMAHLFDRLKALGFTLFDCQLMNPHLAFMGAVEIPRADYLARLSEAVAAPACWT